MRFLHHSFKQIRFLTSTVLMNVWVYPMLIILTLVAILISPLLILYFTISTDWKQFRIYRHMVWYYGNAWIWIISPFVRVNKIGFEEFVQNPGSVIVCNHLSYFDVYFMGALPSPKVGLTSRSWPQKMIWYTAFVKGADYIDLEKNNFEVVSKWVKDNSEDGNFSVFFPEGHRSRNGQMQRFHSGAFKAALVNGISIIPLCIIGSDDLLPPTRKFLRPCDRRRRYYR